MDTGIENTIKVHMIDGSVLKFKEVKSGLFSIHSNNSLDKKVNGYF